MCHPPGRRITVNSLRAIEPACARWTLAAQLSLDNGSYCLGARDFIGAEAFPAIANRESR
jgi:hypothetical protein